jgi:hypothetical protein
MKENVGVSIEVMDETITINGQAYENLGSRPLIALARAVEEYLHDASRDLDGSFHRDVYWPETVDLAVSMTLARRHQMLASQHCLERAFQYGLSENAYMAILRGQVVIARFERGQLIQLVVRVPHRHQAGKDLVGAFQLFRTRSGTHNAKCLTVWVNDAADNHHTLDRSKYVQAPVIELSVEAEGWAEAQEQASFAECGHRAAASSVVAGL